MGDWMDTTEEADGTYWYHGHSNLSAGELFDLIFLEQFCDELGIGIESGAAILLASLGWRQDKNLRGLLKEHSGFQDTKH